MAKHLFPALVVSALAASGHAGALPLAFVAQVQATSAWVTAEQVLQGLESSPPTVRARLAQLRLVPIRNCAEMRISAAALAQEIDRALPGVFERANTDPQQVVRVTVSGHTLSPAEIVTRLEATPLRQCPEALAKPCALRVQQPAEPVCIAQGTVQWQTRVTQTAGEPMPLTVKLDIAVDGVRNASLSLAAQPINGWSAWRVVKSVSHGQALRHSDVEAANVSEAAPVRTQYDLGRGVLVAKGELLVGDVIATDAKQYLATDRRDDEIAVRSEIGPVVVHRTAHLASDRPSGHAGWAQFNNGEIVAVQPSRDGTWELTR